MLQTTLRTHDCGALRRTDEKKRVTLCGWVQEVRNKGHLLWIDLRDRYGITQLILERGITPDETLVKAQKLTRECVLQVTGTVVIRQAPNPNLPTGEIEVRLTTLKLLNEAHTPPFLITDATDGKELLRLQYRYLDLRRPTMMAKIALKAQIMTITRDFFNAQQFLEVETPLLIRSTPEGARNFIVPSRMHKGHYYALPQSPQLLKQLLMISTVDRYYQFAKCFRDEDLRANRQPEFTQLDCELSFVTREDILQLFEKFIHHLFRTAKQIDLPAFPRLTYEQAMEHYGSDQPDLRSPITLINLTQQAKEGHFSHFQEAPHILAFKLPGAADWSRKTIDHYQQKTAVASTTLTYIKYKQDATLNTPIHAHYTTDQLTSWLQITQATPGDLLWIMGGPQTVVQRALGDLRQLLIQEKHLPTNQHFAPLWVTDFPLVEWDAATQRYHSLHHPFTHPSEEDLPLLTTNPTQVRSQAYDLVINGQEVGGGSIRIHTPQLQNQLFTLLGLNTEERETQFGFFLRALHYGTPPHGGIALGVDRLCTLIGGGESIRDYIPFPKNNQGRDPTLETPAKLPKEDLL